MKTLTKEEKRIKLAQACGWSRIHYGANYDTAAMLYGEPPKEWWDAQPSHIRAAKEGYASTELPDYFSDLNAMHVAEKVLEADWYT